MIYLSSRSWRCGLPVVGLVLVCLPFLVSGSQVRDLTTNDLSNIGEITSKNFLVVFFDKPGTRESYPNFLKEFAKSSDVLDSLDIELAKVNCANTKQSLSECSRDQSVFIYRKGDSTVLEKFDLSYLFDVDSIVANLLHISLEERFFHVSNEESLKELISEGKGKKNVVFCFVQGLGLKEHRFFLESVHRSKDDMLFALTTNVAIANEYGISSSVPAAILLLHCKGVKTSGEKCHVTHYHGKIGQIPLRRFFQAQTLPNYVLLPSNRTTVYDSLEPPVNQVFIFSERISDLKIEELEELAKEFEGAVGVVLVDINEHINLLSSFGLSEDNNFPTAAFVPVKANNDSMTYVELYPENIGAFTELNLRQFIKPLVESPSKEYKRLADGSSLLKLRYSEYSDIMRRSDGNYILTSDFLLVVFCTVDNESCSNFSKTLRRVIRTFDRTAGARLSTALIFVKTLEDNEAFRGKQFPVIRLHLNRSRDFIQYDGKLEYGNLVSFIANSNSMKVPVFLRPSLSDEVPILFSEVDEDADADADEDADADAGGSSSPSNEEPDSDSIPPEETEDDEVSATVLNAKVTSTFSDQVPALTDKTFDAVRKDNDLLVVDFFQPWDARCKAFSHPFVETAASIGGLDVGSFAVKLAHVNCFDWTDVCQRNNVTVYPTVKMFRKGFGEIVYDGPLDSNHLTKAVLLLQHNVPLSLTTKDEVQMFFDGTLPKHVKKATDIAVVGMFADEKCKEFMAYETAARFFRSKFLLGYVAGDTAESLSADYGLRIPSVLAFKRSDPYQPLTIFSDSFSSQHVVRFVRRANIPSFGELTPFNLPSYLEHNRPVLIVFRASSEDVSISPVMKKIARGKLLPSVFLCWMPVYSNKDVNAEIVQAYTGSSDSLPALVLVDYREGKFYHYKGEVTMPAVVSWVKNILEDKEQWTGSLAETEWKPLLEGYDFLKMIDEQEEEKERKRIKRKQLEEATAAEDEEGEGVSSEPTEPEPKKTDYPVKPKTSSRPRRPEVKGSVRDEL